MQKQEIHYILSYLFIAHIIFVIAGSWFLVKIFHNIN